MLEVAGLHVAIGRWPVLNGVDFTASAGVWFGVLGANGSGKTTLLRALNGRLPIGAGAVRLAGEDISQNRAALAGRIGYAPPPDSLPGEPSGRELITLLAAARRAEPRPERALYDALDIGWLETETIGAMSAGMRQRLALFTAFIGAPTLVLLDEPFNWLDPVTAYDAKTALRAWTDAGGALVTALHDIASFATRCDEGLLLHEGQVAKRFTPAEIATGRADILAFERAVYETFKAAGR